MADSKIPYNKPNVSVISKSYTATSSSDFLAQIMADALAMGVGVYILSVARHGFYYCTGFVSCQSATRCVVMAVPQPANLNQILIGESNNGTNTYKAVNMTAIS